MNPRIDALIIWGNGLPYRTEIMSALSDHPDFRILKNFRHRPHSIADFVNEVYSFDYAPIEHLRGKIQYLLSTPNEVFVIFFHNLNPDVDYFGEGNYRHEESRTLKIFKEELRNRFNRRLDGKRTEEHVVHASDNPLQSDRLLKYLGVPGGVSQLHPSQRIFSVPYHVSMPKRITIRKVKLESLTCGVMKSKPVTLESPLHFLTEYLPIKQSIQYRSLDEGYQVYEDFLSLFLGDPLTDHYSVSQFKQLADSQWDYLTGPYQNDYIEVVLKEGSYRIVDGLHRAAILLKRGVKEVDVVELS